MLTFVGSGITGSLPNAPNVVLFCLLLFALFCSLYACSKILNAEKVQGPSHFRRVLLYMTTLSKIQVKKNLIHELELF